MQGKKEKTWESYKRSFGKIYILTIVILIVGMLVDYIKRDLFHYTYFIDILTLLVWFISLGLLIAKKFKPSLCFGVAVYALCANVLSSIAVSPSEIHILIHFYRNTVFYALAMTLIAYFVNKSHAFVLAGIYLLFTLLHTYFVGPVLFEHSLTLIFAVVAYSFIIFFFVGLQERTLEDLDAINNQVIHQNEELVQQQEEITVQRDTLARQKKLIESRNSEIIDGIKFAKSIQESVLSKETDISKYFPRYFVIARPKSVISGDFFWVKEWKGYFYISLVDCTGHGVAGALVSMLANMYLGRAFIELENPDPAKILQYISNSIANELRLVDNFHSRIGMDIACVRIDFSTMKMDYAAAFSPMYMIRRDNLTQHEPTKLMIGFNADDGAEYRNQLIDVKKGDRFYLFSDGIVDQFGGSLDKKFGYKRFRNALLDTNHNNMQMQKELFLKKWLNWKSDKTQIDDVLLIGFEI